MKICYIGHSYHRRTASTNFVADFLEAASSDFHRIDTLPDAVSLSDIDPAALREADYDLICIFQLEMLALKIVQAGLRARIVFIPMFDGCRLLGNDYWAEFVDKPNLAVVNFSATLHTKIAALGVRSYRFQYFPPAEKAAASPGPQDRARVFYWQRTDRPSWEVVRQLFADTPDPAFHVHVAGDPALRQTLDTERLSGEADLTVSHWFADPADYRRIVAACDIYVAPREFEGIGMSFLEAMAAGKCVVAPDNPTMNEYIVHGVNGLLYDIDAPAPLDLSDRHRIGKRARQSVQDGHAVWQTDFATRMREVFFAEALPPIETHQEVGSYVWSRRPDPAPDVAAVAKAKLPRVSVALVCYNAADKIAATLQTVLGQSYPEIEIVVVDGASTDDTLAVLEAWRDRIDILVSEPDNGVYDAMSKAAQLATGDYIIFMNVGDFFHLPTALETAIRHVFDTDGAGANLSDPANWPDFIIGNHIYVHSHGGSALHLANDFDDTWEQLQSGRMRGNWWRGIPCHQATLTRRALLAEEGYDPAFSIAADHNLMFAMRAKDKTFAHANTTIATYVGGGMSQQQSVLCISESCRIALRHSPQPEAVRAFYRRSFGLFPFADSAKDFAANVARIRASGLFYTQWYRLTYMTEADGAVDPIVHFLIEGRRQNAMPNPYFDGAHYLLSDSEVADSGVHPFLHYLSHGRQLHRPTYEWDCALSPLRPLGRLFNWRKSDLEDLEALLAAADEPAIRQVF